MQPQLKMTLATVLELQRASVQSRHHSGSRSVCVSNVGTVTNWVVPPISNTEVKGPATLHMRLCSNPREFDEAAQIRPLNSIGRRIDLLIGTQQSAGNVAALLRYADKSPQPLRLNIVGLPAEPLNEVSPQITDGEAMSMWAPTKAALGTSAWRWLRSQSVAIIGAGRTGSMLAEGLYRNGIAVCIIDDDILQPHNLGESAVFIPEDVGRVKSHALADRLQDVTLGLTSISAVAASAQQLRALPLIRNASVLFCAADNSTARLAAAMLAALYLIPLIDLGTGIQRLTAAPDGSHPAERKIGADIRLCLPGRCLLCTGGLANVAEAAQIMIDSRNSQQVPWFEQRAGSLRSLNGCAVHLGLRMFEDWLENRCPHSTNRHTKLLFGNDGTPEIRTSDHPHSDSSECPVCRLTGTGDNGLHDLPRTLEKLLKD